MPRSGGSGAVSWPAGTTAVTGATIESAKFNAFTDDLKSILNSAQPIAYGGTGATSASGARTALDVPGLSSNNIYAGNQTITGTVSITGATSVTGDVTIQSDDAGAAIGPEVNLFRNSASPAGGDVIGGIDFDGNDSGGTRTTYARIVAEATDVTDTTEDGTLRLRTMTAGSFSDALNLAGGVFTPAETDKGRNTINASDYYVGGVLKHREIIKSALESVNSGSTGSTLQADDELLFAMAANTRYDFEFDFWYDTVAAADFKFELDSTGATDPTTVIYTVTYTPPSAVAGNPQSIVYSALNQTVSITSASSGAGYVSVKGFAANDVDAGNLRLRWAQDTANASNTSVYRSSRLKFRAN
jgi:hypothetical protein